MIRVRIPNDNSCLFTSIDYLIHNEYRQYASNELRQLCTTEILSNSRIYNEIYLSKNPIDYCSWLLLDTSWGGEIEISILSKLYNIIIIVIPLNTLRPLRYNNTTTISTINNIIDSTNNSPSFDINSPINDSVNNNETNNNNENNETNNNIEPQNVIFLLYTGQHYDAIIQESDFKKLFTVTNEEEINHLESLAIECCRIEKENLEKELKTRIRKKIKCCGCGILLENGNEFQIHCETFEHNDDFCYECEEVNITEMVENINDD